MERNLHRLAAAALILLFFGIAAGQEGYAYRRAVEAKEAGWARIVIPEDMYGRLRPGFPDIRIYSGVGMKEIPYVLRRPESADELTVEFRLINSTASGKRRFFTLESDGNEIVNRMELRFKRPNYDYRVLLEGSNDQIEWRTILGDSRILSIRNDLTDYTFSTLKFQDVRFRFFRISFESDDDPGGLEASLVRTVENREAVGAVKVRSFSADDDSVEKSTVLSIRLERTVPVSGVRLRTESGTDYYRHVEVLYRSGTDTQGRDLFRRAAEGTLSSLDASPVGFSDVLTNGLRLVVRNGDSPPLSYSEPQVTGPRYELVANFPAPGGYFLYYSNSEAIGPEYDLATFASRAGPDLTAVKVGPEEVSETGRGERAPFASNWWLLPVMAAIAVVMLIFAYRLIRKGS